jgi:hypothetical protein
VIIIIGEAAELGWLEFDETIERIQQTGFHLSDAVIEAVRCNLRS